MTVMPTNYLSPQGFEKLQNELKKLMDVERPVVVQSVSDAAALGDRSENAEYIYGKKRLREIDRRIRFLGKRLELVEVIDPLSKTYDSVRFGAWVLLEKNNSEKVTVQILGPDEIDPINGVITYSSPLGKALLGKEEGDEISVTILEQKTNYRLIKIRNSKIT